MRQIEPRDSVLGRLHHSGMEHDLVPGAIAIGGVGVDPGIGEGSGNVLSPEGKNGHIPLNRDAAGRDAHALAVNERRLARVQQFDGCLK